jgi:hypothetical protein
MADIVVVGCKLPNGLIIRQGGVEVKLNGLNHSEIIGGHGITRVDKDLWEAWYLDHMDFAPVANGFVFANTSEKSTAAEAKEKEKEVTGFEGINPDKPGGGVEKAKAE